MDIQSSKIAEHISQSKMYPGSIGVLGASSCIPTPVHVSCTTQTVRITQQNGRCATYALPRVDNVIKSNDMLTFHIDDFYIVEIPLTTTEPANSPAH